MIGRALKRIGKIAATPITAPAKLFRRGAERTMQAAVLGVIRHVLTTLGGALVGSGTMTGDELNAAIGAILTLVGVIWSVAQKRAAQAGS